jgi:hypothetical protein
MTDRSKKPIFQDSAAFRARRAIHTRFDHKSCGRRIHAWRIEMRIQQAKRAHVQKHGGNAEAAQCLSEQYPEFSSSRELVGRSQRGHDESRDRLASMIRR